METNSTLSNYKEEEKQLSESLYRNLHTMQRFYEPTPDFLLVFEPHMFIKSNAKAFIHVMHFIFNCLDGAEFNKRFRWPILDKNGETHFRKCSLDYMNHLNVVHQLGLQTLHLSNIHIPGGLKFIKIIHKFSYLVMMVEVNKPEHGPLPDIHCIPDPDEQLVKLEEFAERAMDFATKLQQQSDRITERMDEMKAMVEKCFEGTNTELGCWACYQDEWRDELDRIVRDEVAPKLEVINEFSRQTVQLDQLLTKLFVDKKENIVQYDKKQLAVAQNVLKNVQPNLEPSIDGIVQGNNINFENLFKVFSFMLPSLMNKLETFKFRDPEAIEFEYNELVQLDTIATKYQDEYNKYQPLIQRFIDKDEENFRTFCQNYKNLPLPFCVMATPPVTRRAGKAKNRLGLTNDLIGKTKLFKEPSTRPQSKNTTLSSRTSSCSSLSNYKSHDAALQLLGKPKSRANLSQTTLRNTSALSKFSTPKFSSTMSSNRKCQQPELKFSPAFAMTPTHVFSENFTETTSTLSPNGISVVRKSATSSVFLNHPQIRSPTRHFQVTNIPRDFVAFYEATGNRAENGTTMDAVRNDVHVEITNGVNHEAMAGGIQPFDNNGATLNAASIGTEAEPADDFIGNISDTLLHDISSE